jgi:hypothetical protein
MAWRENYRRVSNGEQYLLAAHASFTHPISKVWSGYWQRGAAVRNTTGTYQHTINGLLQKQAEMMEEIGATRERLAVL